MFLFFDGHSSALAANVAGLRAAQAALRQNIYPALGGPTLERPPEFPGGFAMPPED